MNKSMNSISIILGILIAINLIMNIAEHNWQATTGWFLAQLEWVQVAILKRML